MNAIDRDAVNWAFEHFYHMDKANACMHCAQVKFSPITFRLVDALLTVWPEGEKITVEMGEVMEHQNRYDLDPGR
jgi:hypothetical protein